MGKKLVVEGKIKLYVSGGIKAKWNDFSPRCPCVCFSFMPCYAVCAPPSLHVHSQDIRFPNLKSHDAPDAVEYSCSPPCD
jgi:hypothetical protein